jgi:hypothetical protein
MSFFPRREPPRYSEGLDQRAYAYAPVRQAPRTAENYLDKAMDPDANYFYKKLRSDFKKDDLARDTFENKARALSNITEVGQKDKDSRKTLTALHDRLVATSHHHNHGSSHQHRVHATNQLVNAIEQAVVKVYDRDVDGNEDHHWLLEYELYDGIDPSNRIFLCGLLPPCGYWLNHTDDDEHDLRYDYQQMHNSFWQYVKWGLIVVTLGLVAFALVWLSTAQASFYTCQKDTPKLSSTGIQVREADRSGFMECSDLINRCYMKPITMSVNEYYTARILIYVISALPIVFLLSSACFISARMLAPLKPGGKEAGGANSSGGGCCFKTYEIKNFYNNATMAVFFTHVVGGAVTLIMDFSMVAYIAALSIDAKCGEGKRNGTNVYQITSARTDDECACSILLKGLSQSPEGFTKVSDFQLMNPGNVALALGCLNMLYTLWGVIFVLQHWRFLRNTDNYHSAHGRNENKKKEKKKNKETSDEMAVNGMSSEQHDNRSNLAAEMQVIASHQLSNTPVIPARTTVVPAPFKGIA